MANRSIQKPQIDIILDSIADGVFTIDLEKNVTSFNRAAEKITGIPRDQAVGQKCFDVFHSSICQNDCALEKTLTTGRHVIDRLVDIINSRGETVPISVSTALLTDDQGTVTGGVETFRDLSAIEEMRRRIEQQYSFHDIITKNHKLQQMLTVLPDIAESESTVLLQGPSGSGKELLARAIHTLSMRREQPFIAVNCSALPDTLLESELFGYTKGAFTGAHKDKPGRFARARGGTLFLDEIGDISTALQVKLLRVLQEREYEPLGGSGPVTSDVRILAATNKNLEELLARGSFREDLYYRLNVIRLELPPLRNRTEDIPLLVDHFLNRFNAVRKGPIIHGVSSDVMRHLMAYDFPGNIRELENIIERAFVLCRGAVITREHIPPEIFSSTLPPGTTEDTSASSIKKAEAHIIREALQHNNGHRGNTARALGMNPSTLWRKMKKFGITD